jgi:hypothetical protein
MELNAAKHHQIACSKVFQFTHNLATNEIGVNHPNQYFEASQQYRHGAAKPEPRSNTQKSASASQPDPAKAQPASGDDDIDDFMNQCFDNLGY